jgi:hypothetical protein
MSSYYPPGFGGAFDLDYVEGPTTEKELEEKCPRCGNAGGYGLMIQTWRSAPPSIFCTGCDYERDEADGGVRRGREIMRLEQGE